MKIQIPLVFVTALLVPPCRCSTFSSWFSASDGEEESKLNEDLVSPLINRELETTVVAHDWPFVVDNVYCEAWAHQQDWDYMTSFVQKSKVVQTPEEAMEVVLSVTDKKKHPFLKYVLALRAYSPLCELHRKLARQLVVQDDILMGRKGIEAFCVIAGQVATTADELTFLIESLGPPTSPDADQDIILPDEPVRGEQGHTIVLYANMGSSAFKELYLNLVLTKNKFVLRHMGDIHYEEMGGSPTVLQGFGVRLDIRNVEYRVFDDRAEKDLNETSLVNVSNVDLIQNQFLAGINVAALADLNDTETLKLQADSWKMHEAQQIQSQLVPPKWQRRQLALQATTVISQASDVLYTLQDVAQNLPSVASTLVHVSIPDHVSEMAKHFEQVLSQTKGVALTINGRKVSIGRPSFNVFELLKMIQEEQRALDGMAKKLGRFLGIDSLVQVQKAWNRGEASFLGTTPASDMEDEEEMGMSGDVKRIDVGRGWKGAVMYMNDVEKDAQYRDWPRSLQQAMMAMQFGAPPSVRRNLFTTLTVLDPIQEDAMEHLGMNLGSQLVQASYPVRLGFLIVNDDDVAECREWLRDNDVDDSEPCPTKEILTKKVTLDELVDIPASTHAAHCLVAKAAVDIASGDGSAMTAFVQYFVQALDQQKGEGSMTMRDLVMVYGQLMDMILGGRSQSAMQEAIEALYEKNEGSDKGPSYGKALRFAITKNIKHGMGFINGRPLPTSGNPSQVFMDEQNHIFGLIMKGEINDTSPRSVYGKLLTGSAVFQRLHPLLHDSGDEAYLDMAHGFSMEALRLPTSHNPKEAPDAVFVIEAIFDPTTLQGRSFALAFMNVMKSYPASVEDGGSASILGIAYKIIPSPNVKAVGLCSVLANAGLMSDADMDTILSNELISTMTVEEILELLPGLADGAHRTISSHTCSKEWGTPDMPTENFVAANGKRFVPEGAVLEEDIDMLIQIGLGRSKATTSMLKDTLSYPDKASFEAIYATTIFLSTKFRTEKERPRVDFVHKIAEIEKELSVKNPFRFSWNMENTKELKIHASVVLDPVTEAAQRLAPFLLVFRDILQLPLQVIFAPKVIVGDDIPITSFYRFVADSSAAYASPKASFLNLPTNHILTLRLDVPEPWNVQQVGAIQDTDNLRCDIHSGCSDDAHTGVDNDVPIHRKRHATIVEYGLKNLLFFGQCYDATTQSPPNGLELTLEDRASPQEKKQDAIVNMDGTVDEPVFKGSPQLYDDTLVMKTVGYWQLRAAPGVWKLNIASGSRGEEIFDIVDGSVNKGKIKLSKNAVNNSTKMLVMKDFTDKQELLLLKRRSGHEKDAVLSRKSKKNEEDDIINVFSLATGHLYERFLKIMMLSVTKRSSLKVKFWLFENYLSPTFKASTIAMAHRIGCDVQFVTYKWPEWLRGQSEKQRIIWGYKILFLDVLFPLSVKKIIYVDADQVVRGDLKELWNMDLEGAPYGYTPMCSSREETLGFQFWQGGFWASHLAGRPYHISALYVVDLEKFRKDLVGDQLRSTYQQLSADPNSLANLDQDLPNYAQHQVPIFSLPQEWLWCESWCSDESKAAAKTIDLCNNPLHKEPKVSMAQRIISGHLFEESWVELDAEVEAHEQEYFG